MNNTIKAALNLVNGEFQPGSYLRSSAEMRADQATWDDLDKVGKAFDFTTSPYWITSDDGMEPYGIDEDDEFRAFQAGL